MKNVKLLVATAMMAIIAAPAAHAVSKNGQGSANIVAPLNFVNTAGLRFGDIAPHLTQAGTVEIETDDNKICGTNLTCFATSPTGAAAFDVTGYADAVYDISVPASVTLNGTGSAGGSNMTATLVGSKASGTLTLGTDSFTVGGTLSVGADQTVGPYAGTFVVSISYQ